MKKRGFTAEERKRAPERAGRAPTQRKRKGREKAVSVKASSYGRYTGEDFGSERRGPDEGAVGFFLESGFNNPYMQFSELNQHSLEDLKRAIEQALERASMFDRRARRADPAAAGEYVARSRLDQLLSQMVQKLVDEGYINTGGEQQGGGGEGRMPRSRFKVTDKSVDFLGFKTLKDLLGSLGNSSFGAHDTRDMATGVETSRSGQAVRVRRHAESGYRADAVFGVPAGGREGPAESGIRRTCTCTSREYQSSCATVLMLDCSHSMILYGEDRFTPAKKVALALAHLIRMQYPGDTLRCVLFHDSARGTADRGAGPGAGGSVLHQHARRADPGAAPAGAGAQGHEADHHDHGRQAECADARRRAHLSQRVRPGSAGDQQDARRSEPLQAQGILINTFMLASDYGLVNFIQKVTELCRGKAYFTTPYTLGQYLLMDYMNRKTRTIH